MLLSDFDFILPKELIAQKPIEPRTHSRMLVINDKTLDSYFNNFINFVNKNDLLILNDSKVIPAFLIGRVNEKTISINLHKKINKTDWFCFAKNSKQINAGDIIQFGFDFSATVISKNFGELMISFGPDIDLLPKLEQYGKMPLPPYIKDYNEKTKIDYQTVYAKDPGSVAAPTAGLHFTQEYIRALENKTNVDYLTLHVGAGTFLPVKTENIHEHKMHSESFEISDKLREKIHNTKKNGGRIIAVGTTTLRALESGIDNNNTATEIFITPGYKFKVVDVLLTNFHLPKSTLFMLVCAFAGYEKMRLAYEHAISSGYRFFSYGDCCLLTRTEND